MPQENAARLTVNLIPAQEEVLFLAVLNLFIPSVHTSLYFRSRLNKFPKRGNIMR